MQFEWPHRHEIGQRMEVFDARYVPLATVNFYNLADERLGRLAPLATDDPPPVLVPEVVRRVS